MNTRLLTFIAVLAIAGACKPESKPIIYGANVSEDELAAGNSWVEQVKTLAAQENAQVVLRRIRRH